jgi:hypothetical protein
LTPRTPRLSRAQKLRALLARCAEWSDDAARLRLADTLDAAPPSSMDHGRLVSCLRGTDTMAALRKVDLIALARGWCVSPGSV